MDDLEMLLQGCEDVTMGALISAEPAEIAEDQDSDADLEMKEVTPEMLRALFEGTCVLSFVYPDGSLVESVTTLNQDILNMHGLGQLDGLIDLQERRVIPECMFETLKGIRKGDKKRLSELDEFFEIGGKIGW